MENVVKQKEVLRKDEIVCTRTLFSDGTSEVIMEFRKSDPGAPDLNNESVNFMLSFMSAFIKKWRQEIFSIRRQE